MALNISGTSSRFINARKIISAAFAINPQPASQSRSFTVSSCTHLYTKEALGLQGYEKTREKTATELGKMKDRFKERMNQYLGENSTALIFTEDLKNILYLSDSDTDLAMVDKMMRKYAKQNEQMRFGSFVFGPVIMRMFYHLGKVDLALASVKDPETIGMYDQLTSYQILLDLLYENKRYNEMLEVFDILKNRPFFNGKFPKDCLVLAIAACYKMGTPEAYKKALELIKSAVDANAPIMRKAVSLAAYLALQNNDSAGALELLAIAPNQSYVTIRNLKALALLKMDRLDDVLPVLRSVIEQDIAYQKRVTPNFFDDVFSQIKEAVAKSTDAELKNEFEKVFKSLEAGNHIEKSTLAEFLERPIEDFKRMLPGQSLEQGAAGSYQNRGYSRYQPEGTSQPLRQPRYRDDYQSAGSSTGGGQDQVSTGRQSYSQRGGRYQDRSGEQGGREGSSFSSYQGRSGGQGGYSSGSYQDRSSGGRYGGGQSGGGYRRGQQQESGMSEDGGSQEGRGGRSTGGYNANVEAGYRPQGPGYRQRGVATRQGLQDLDD